MSNKNKNYPTFDFEKALWNKGLNFIAGIDEVGCGCWAGPLVCAAVILPKDFNDPGVNDSKLLSESKREQFHDIIIKQALAYAIGESSEKEIDVFGLTQAKIRAIKRAINLLNINPEYILVDGNNIKIDNIPNEAIIKGDQKVISIACASIIAKVYRDRKITELAKEYTYYKFENNKGYGTKDHIHALEKYGPCSIHRKSYAPIKKYYKNK